MIPFPDLGETKALPGIPADLHLSAEDVELIANWMNQY